MFGILPCMKQGGLDRVNERSPKDTPTPSIRASEWGGCVYPHSPLLALRVPLAYFGTFLPTVYTYICMCEYSDGTPGFIISFVDTLFHFLFVLHVFSSDWVSSDCDRASRVIFVSRRFGLVFSESRLQSAKMEGLASIPPFANPAATVAPRPTQGAALPTAVPGRPHSEPVSPHRRPPTLGGPHNIFTNNAWKI